MSKKFLKKSADIKKWLQEYGIPLERCTLIKNKKYGFIVDVDTDIILIHKKLSFIPVKFNKVHGVFNCAKNELTSLEFCPKEVLAFNCAYNKLTSLEFCPEHIHNKFVAMTNNLQNLIFFPKSVGGNTYIWNNEALEQFQYVNDFDELYKLHRKQVVEQQKNSLQEKLNTLPLDLSPKSKIKI